MLLPEDGAQSPRPAEVGEILARGRAGNGNAFQLPLDYPVHLGLDALFHLRDLDGVVCYFNTGAVVAGLATVFLLKSWKS